MNYPVDLREFNEHRVIENRQKAEVLKNLEVNHVQLELIKAYQYGYRGQIGRTDKKTCGKHKCGIIVGYRLKNIDNKPLNYVKCKYTSQGIEHYKRTVNPGEEFIITRDEVKYLMLQNGNDLSNATIRRGYTDDDKRLIEAIQPTNSRIKDRTDIQSREIDFFKSLASMRYSLIGQTFVRRSGLPYICFKGKTGKSIRQKEYCVSISKVQGTTIKLIDSPEIRSAFYWVEDGYIKDKYSNYYSVVPNDVIDDILLNHDKYSSSGYTVNGIDIPLYQCPNKQDSQYSKIKSTMMKEIASKIKIKNRDIQALSEKSTIQKQKVNHLIIKALCSQNGRKYRLRNLLHRDAQMYSDIRGDIDASAGEAKSYLCWQMKSIMSKQRYEKIQFISNLDKEELNNYYVRFKLAGLEHSKILGQDVYWKDDTGGRQVYILNKEAIRLLQLHRLIKNCRYIGVLDLRGCTVISTQLHSTFGSGKQRIDKIYIGKVGLPGGQIFYSDNHVVVSDDLKNKVLSQGFRAINDCDKCVDDLLSSCVDKLQRNGVSKWQTNAIVNLIKCGEIYYYNKAYPEAIKIMSSLGIIHEEDVIIIEECGLMHDILKAANDIQMMFLQFLFDKVSRNTEIISNNKYLDLALERRGMLLRNR